MIRSRKYIYGIATILLITIFFSYLQGNTNKNILGAWDRIAISHTPTVTVIPTKSVPPEIMPSGNSLYPVVKVIDGDTLVVLIGGISQTVRLIGVNTPESVDPRRPVECFGNEASEKAKSLLSEHSVSIVVDPTQGERDKYGRLLRYVFRDDGLFINKQMIKDGFAYEYTYDAPYQYQSEFKKVQFEAQQAQLGLWNPEADCSAAIEISPFEDKDCRDFQTQKEAMDFYLASGGPDRDPHKLDSNGDGSVCESLP